MSGLRGVIAATVVTALVLLCTAGFSVALGAPAVSAYAFTWGGAWDERPLTFGISPGYTWSAGAYDPYRTAAYAPYPSIPRYSAWESRPEGYGTVNAQYGYSDMGRACENDYFLGHTTGWRRDRYVSGITGMPRSSPRARLMNNGCSPTRYSPYDYWP